MSKCPISECVITYNPATHLFGFQCRFPGKPPHWQMEVLYSVDDVLSWVDPHQERVWEEAGDADESRLMISRSYKPGTVMYRMHNCADHEDRGLA